MRLLNVIVMTLFLAGCAHDSATKRASSSSRPKGPLDEAQVIAVARKTVAEREHWKKSDFVVSHKGSDWKATGCQVPSRINCWWVSMTIAEDGTVTRYEKWYNYE